jgi:tetraacyldisaccharide 4'-kinase
VQAWLEARLARHWWQPQPPALLTLLLFPFSLLYLGLWLLRRYRQRPAAPLPVPVVVVGNHVVGGAGKTPTVIALVQALQAAGRRPGVISRGHGRQGHAPQAVEPGTDVALAGDEPLLIRRRTGVPVWVGRARRDAGLALTAAHPEVDVIVSDDGLQHAALPRQAELVVFDERGVGNGMLLPTGPLREPLPAQLPPWMRVLYTAGVNSTPLPGAAATRRISQVWPLQAWLAGDASQAQALTALQGRPLVAAAGMAAPEKFFHMLRALGLDIRALPLPDHHAYAQLPWPPTTAEVLVTEKDAIKLDPSRQGATRVWVVPLDFHIPPALVSELLALLPLPRPTRTSSAHAHEPGPPTD